MDENPMITNKPDAPLVSRAVADGVNAARERGMYNMFDTIGVCNWCRLFGHSDAAQWIESHEESYAKAIFNGFRVEEQENS